MTYSAIIGIHTIIGFFTLISFWIAALSKKGSKIHSQAGKFYLLSMVVILASIVPMLVSKWNSGEYAFCILLGFLFCIAFTASLITWRSIQQKKYLEKYFNSAMKISAGILFIYALIILGIGLMLGDFLPFVFSGVGFVLAGSVAYAYYKKERPKNWYLSQHMNGVAVNFAATHGSFFRFGLAGLLPIPDSPELNTVAQTSMILLALLLRLLLAKLYLKR